MVQDSDRYQFVTGQTRYYNDKIIESFNLFIKLASAIVAGVLWLHLQELDDPTKTHYGQMAMLVLGLVTLGTGLLLLNNLRAWWGYRKAESALVGEETVPPPHFPMSCSSEILEVSMMIVFCVVFVVLNPL